MTNTTRAYPHTITNGHGEELTFERRVVTPQGEQLEGFNRVQPGKGPPFHTHFHEEEGFTVVTGRMAWQVKGQAEGFAEVGDSVTFPPGVAHRFWNAGDTELRCAAIVRPPGNIEYFLERIFEAQKRSGGTRPDLFDASYLLWRYRTEYRMDSLPWIVRKLVVPLVALIGHATGRYRKFADAPEPRRTRGP